MGKVGGLCRRLSLGLLLAALALCGSFACLADRPEQAPKDELRVLFIGNSLTYTNDLPAIIEALAKATKKPPRFVYKSIALPDFGLAEHWQQGDARKAIARDKWDIVVLQQGPSALPESRAVLLDYVRRFDAEIKKSGARTALYMVWPAASRSGDFDRVSESYRLAAEAVNGILFPAGEAWRAAWRQDAKLALYSSDGFHPSPAGSYLAALVIYEQLYEQAFSGPLPIQNRSQLSAQQADVLRQAAAEANARFGKR